MKPVKITDRNVMFTQPWPSGADFDINIGLIIGDHRNYIIDTGFGSNSVAPILEYLGGDKKQIVVINTHCDWDHVWGNHVFADSVIIAHTKTRELIDQHWDECLERCNKYIDGEVIKCLPNLVFDDRICFPDDGVEIFYSPGHTIGCISVYDCVDKVLYAGDNIGDTMDMIVPEIHTDIETFKRLIELYKGYDFEVCVSGHNKPLGREVIGLMEATLSSPRNQENL